MVAGPLPTPSGQGKDRLRLWIRLLRASRTIEAELRDSWFSPPNQDAPRGDLLADLREELISSRGPFWTPGEVAKSLPEASRARLAA